MQFRMIGAIGLALVVCLPSTVLPVLAGPERPVPQLTVIGEGRAMAIPDKATLQLGVLAENPNAAEAIREVSERLSGVLERLAAEGIEARDIQTSGFSVSPRWYGRKSSSGVPNRIETFAASSSLTVGVRDLERLGVLLDSVVEDGADIFQSLTFGLQQPQFKRDEARRAAMADALRKAELYAGAAGLGLGPILSIDEDADGAGRPSGAARVGYAAEAGVPVAGGEISFTASVTVTFGLLPAD